MQIKTTVRYCLTPDSMAIIKKTITSAGEDVEKREPLCTIGGTVNWCSHHGNQYGDSSKKKKKYNYHMIPTILLLHIHSLEGNKNTNLERYTHPLVHRSIVYNSQDKDTT